MRTGCKRLDLPGDHDAQSSPNVERCSYCKDHVQPHARQRESINSMIDGARDVLFYNTHKPSVYVAKKAALKGGMSVHLWGDGGTPSAGPGVYLLDSSTADTERALEVAVELRGHAAESGTMLILDGWSSHPRPALFELIRCASGASGEGLLQFSFLATGSRLPRRALS